MSCYIVQEVDGVSRFTLEDASGFLVLEDCIPTPGGGDIVVGGLPIRRSRRRHREQIGDEEAVISLTLSELL